MKMGCVPQSLNIFGSGVVRDLPDFSHEKRIKTPALRGVFTLGIR